MCQDFILSKILQFIIIVFFWYNYVVYVFNSHFQEVMTIKNIEDHVHSKMRIFCEILRIRQIIIHLNIFFIFFGLQLVSVD